MSLHPANSGPKGADRPSTLVHSIAAVIAAGALALALHGSAEASCHPVFVAGEGIIDSCTGNHRSPYPDPPPEPTIIYVEVVVSPTINVVNNVTSSSYSVSSSTASANAGASSSINNIRIRPVVKKAKP